MARVSGGISSLSQFSRWFRRRVLQRGPWRNASPASHESLLADRIRCDAYREAIRLTVKPGDVVVDLGAGTGLLSFFAAQAGARRVYAIEASGIADVAAELIEANGFRDRITLIRKNSKRVRLPERCDVLVTETLSSLCFDTESIVEFVADARERFLKPGGRIIPQSADTFFMPFSSDAFGIGRLNTNEPGETPAFYGLDYKPFVKKLSEDYRLVSASSKQFTSMSPPGLAYHLDFHKDVRNPSKTFIPFRITEDGRLDGFLAWFEAQLCEGVTLSNSPYLPLTHWKQLYLPLLDQPNYLAGQTVLLYLDPNCVGGEAEWIYAVQLANSDHWNPIAISDPSAIEKK
jgi:type I protein arginine methyltransferase